MSIDYDRLRELSDRASPSPWRAGQHGYMGGQAIYNKNGVPLAFNVSGDNSELAALAPDMARELLALRDEIERTRDRVADELERIGPELQAARITLYAEREQVLDFCNSLLDGDNE